VTCASFFKCFFRNTFDLFHSLTIHYKSDFCVECSRLILFFYRCRTKTAYPPPSRSRDR
jgi:hypothetical protein